MMVAEVMVTVGMAAARAAVMAALCITYCRQKRPLARRPKETQKKSLDAAVA